MKEIWIRETRELCVICNFSANVQLLQNKVPSKKKADHVELTITALFN